MMCVRLDLTMDYLKAFERNGVELLHIDVMDGTFVPNITIGVDYVKQLREISRQPFDFFLRIGYNGKDTLSDDTLISSRITACRFCRNDPISAVDLKADRWIFPCKVIFSAGLCTEKPEGIMIVFASIAVVQRHDINAVLICKSNAHQLFLFQKSGNLCGIVHSAVFAAHDMLHF